VLAEIERLRQDDVVRLIDMIVVKKSEDGELETFSQKTSTLRLSSARSWARCRIGAGGEEGAEIGAVRGAEAAVDGDLLDDQEVWYVADAIPNGSAAAIALIEHRWAIGLRDSIFRAGGFHLADAWIHPRDLVAIGLAAAEVADTA
jgi:uncharacterized membrane protein